MSEFTVLKINDLETLLHILESYERVVVDFGAPSWCVPCRQLTPHFHYASEHMEGKALFVEVDIDESPEIADRFNILSVPTVLLFEDGELSRPIEGRTAIKIINEVG